jgi:hypothetical protein
MRNAYGSVKERYGLRNLARREWENNIKVDVK